MSSSSETNADFPRFQSISRLEVPNSRGGKHKKIMLELLNDIEQLQPGHALKIPLASLPDVKENIRAALSRATQKRQINVATSSDADFLYIWKIESNPDDSNP